MTLAWSSTRTTLAAKLAVAAQGDRAAIVAALNRLDTLGPRYDAAIAAGTLTAAAGSTLAAVEASQRTAAGAALLRAVRYLEGLPGVADPLVTFYTSADDVESASDAAPTPAAVALWYTPARLPAPASWSADASRRTPMELRVESLLPGAEGNRLAVRFYLSEGAQIEVQYRGRVIKTRRLADASNGNGGLNGELSGLVRVTGGLYGGTGAESLFTTLPGPHTLTGGTGGALLTIQNRARLALSAGRACRGALERAGDTGGLATLDLALSRVGDLDAAAAGGGIVAGDDAAPLERELAAAVDAANRLAVYLG